jgi:hypothetical protein
VIVVVALGVGEAMGAPGLALAVIMPLDFVGWLIVILAVARRDRERSS